MYFCQDVDLMAWEPGTFLEPAFVHQSLISGNSATLTGTALVMGASVLGALLPGMVAKITLADDSLTQLVEIVSIADGTHAVVSALRGRSTESAIAPLVGGSVKVSVLTFRPQIAAVGDGLFAALGVASDRDSDPSAATADLRGFRTAAIFGALAAIFRTISTNTGASAALLAKRDFYEKLASQARRALEGRVDRNHDGIAEHATSAAVGELIRQ